MENIFDDGRKNIKSEISWDLFKGKNLRIEKIVSMGQVSDWMSSDENEWVSVVLGRGALGFPDGTSTILNAGDNILIPGGKTHRVEFTSKPCIWLCIYFNE